MKLIFAETDRERAQSARTELTTAHQKFLACRARRDGLIALRDTSRQAAAHIVQKGVPEKDADVDKLMREERRGAWCEVALESAQIEMNGAGECVRNAMRPATDVLSSALAPVLKTLIEEATVRLTPTLGEDQARAAGNDALAVRKLRTFLSNLPTAITAVDAAGDVIQWLAEMLDNNRAPQGAAE